MSNTLALLGGAKTLDSTSNNFSVPLVNKRAYSVINGLLEKGEISTSPVVGAFERRFASYIGVKHGLCVVNGTTSIQAALYACGVRTGDEVIVPTFTFWASVGPVVACGGVPVFCDVDIDTQCITAENIKKRITKKTKAIVVVHVWGNPCDMDSIMELARANDLKVVEDCSHAHGATYKGKKVGSFGDIGCFSLQGSKLLAAGEGGILVTDNQDYLEAAAALGHYERLGGLADNSPYKKYSITGFGFKHRANPLGIAVADANLDTLDELNEVRNRQGKYLEECIADIDFIVPQKVYDKAERVYAYHYARLIPEKANGLNVVTLLKALAAEGVCCGSCGYGKLHEQPLYEGKGPYGEGGPFHSKALDIPYAVTSSAELANSITLNETALMLAPRFEVECKDSIKLYVEAYHKIAENLEQLLDYQERENLKNAKIKNKGTSINYFK